MSDGRKRKPTPVGDVVSEWLGDSGLGPRVDQAAIIPEWPSLVGRTIAAVTTPQSITSNGTLFVKVTTNAWITELSLLEPELSRSINSKPGRSHVKRIRWLLK